MSILFCTPAYGGQVTLAYFRSCLNLAEQLRIGGVDYEFLTTDKESLIQRARNEQASTFLETDFKKMMFIDADIEFSPEDVARLWNLDADIAVGVYCMKKPSAPYAAWHHGKLLTDLPAEPIEVDYAGTGFMMIDRRVLEAMKSEKRHYLSKSSCWNFFDCRVDGDSFLSEDYAFCQDAREMGFKIIMDPECKLKHWGTYAYGA